MRHSRINFDQLTPPVDPSPNLKTSEILIVNVIATKSQRGACNMVAGGTCFVPPCGTRRQAAPLTQLIKEIIFWWLSCLIQNILFKLTLCPFLDSVLLVHLRVSLTSNRSSESVMDRRPAEHGEKDWMGY